MPPSTWLYRHDELDIGRPYDLDVDEQGWLWEGTSQNRLLGHHLNTAELRIEVIPELGGHVPFAVFACGGKLVLLLGECPYYLVVDVNTRQSVRREMPTTAGARPIAWYGVKLPGDRLMFFQRGARLGVMLDGPDAAPRVVPCPYEGDYASGTLASDGLVYTFLADPARVVRFDPGAGRFMDERPLPWPQAACSGRFEHGGVMYCADSVGGRLLPLDLRTQQWLDPIVHPDHGKVFGFIGIGFGFGGKGYYSLSTYAARSRLDTRTGKLIIPTDQPLSVDGRAYRFMEKYLIFDPETRKFEYLEAPAQPDGVPLLCYAWANADRFAISGIVLPFAEPGHPGDHAQHHGPWLVLQNREAKAAPPLGPFNFAWDRGAHLRQYRRSYPANRSLYLPEGPWTPAIVNMQGPATPYPPGRAAELTRRAERTDARQYWNDVAARLCPPDADPATRVRLICGHVQHHIYYNPIQEPRTPSPIAAHEAHDGRCGIAQEIVLALCAAAGVEARASLLVHHTVAEAFYDGAWHIADALFFGGQQPARDGRVLSVAELQGDPYFADTCPLAAMAYDPELLLSEDGFGVLGYVFGPWGSEPYYSYYLGAPKDQPPTLPVVLPAQRLGGNRVRLAWSPSVKFQGGAIEYDLRVYADRACTQAIFVQVTTTTSMEFMVPEMNRMYFVEVRALDDHRQKNPDTWYPAPRANFVLVPESQYGWYGVL